MNINHLKYVIEVANSSSMREASTKLFVSQPALSASIRELEEELGIVIFERTKEVLEYVRDLKSEVGIVTYSSAYEDLIKKLIKEYSLEFVGGVLGP